MRIFVIVTAVVAAASAPAQQPTLRVVARDYALSLAPSAAAGDTRVRLVNRGTEPHYFGIVRADSGKGAQDYLAWRAARGPRPGWLTSVGGIAPVMPGDSADLVLPLAAGRYVVFCSYPSPDGTSHVAKGMVGDLVVEGAPAAAPSPRAELTVRLADYSFAPSGGAAAVRAGRRAIRVVNEGTQLHQMLVVRMPPGATAERETAWFRGGGRGPRPGVPTGGVLQIPPGDTATAIVRLRPGRYLLLCTVADAAGTPHYRHGMVREIRVR